MNENFSCLDPGSDIIICMEGCTTKTGSLKILHNESPDSQHNILVNINQEVHLTKAGHPGLLVREESQLVIGHEGQPESCSFTQSDI